MSFDEVVRLIEKRTGVMLSGSRLSRMKRLYEAEKNLFRGLVYKDMTDPAWHRIIEALSVQETYFYRDAEVFDCIKSQILPKLIHSGFGELKIWSAGCATGEEAYTLAIITFELFREMGKDPRGRVKVLGTDISEEAIKVARAGIYRDIPMGSFRKTTREFMKYFEATELGFHVREEIRELVEFRVHNLVDPAPPVKDVDLAICRNVLIYFTEEAKEIAYDNLVASMRKGGVLVLGPLDNPGRGLEKHYCDKVVYFVKP